MVLIPVHSIDDPRLAPYRELNQRNLTRQSGRFIAEGEKVVQRLLASRYELDSVLAEPAFAERYAGHVSPEVPIYVAPRPLLMATVGFHFHRGILACGRRRGGPLVREVIGAEAILDAERTILVCPDVQDPTNLGSIIRSAAAFGCAAVVLGDKCADPFSRRVLRVSMGTALHLPIVESRDLAADLRDLAAAGFELVAAVTDPGAEPLQAAPRRNRLAILLGGEGHGLADPWLALCHRRVTIPMQLGVDSLNVAIAAAVILYQFTILGYKAASRK